jgi:hypothetical protein
LEPRQRNPNLVHWIGEVPSQDLFGSVLTIGEIERGIEWQRQLDPEFAGKDYVQAGYDFAHL